MAAEEDLDGGGVGAVRGGGGEGLEEGEELFAGARGEGVHGVGDDVGVLAAAQVEAEANAAGVRVGVGVGDDGDAGGVGEAHGDGHGGSEVRGGGELGGGGSWREGSGEGDALGVRCNLRRRGSVRGNLGAG